jgi:hypothetical protein
VKTTASPALAAEPAPTSIYRGAMTVMYNELTGVPPTARHTRAPTNTPTSTPTSQPTRKQCTSVCEKSCNTFVR